MERSVQHRLPQGSQQGVQEGLAAILRLGLRAELDRTHTLLSLSLQVWLQFQDEGGFEFGLAHSVVDALLYLLQEAYQWLSLVLPTSELWAIVPVTSADEVMICSHACE
jgi:hypothetical protein